MRSKAAVLHEFEKPLRLEIVDLPEVGAGDVLVRIEASGICHSDLHIYHGREKGKMPLILGHECAGVIEQIGSNVKNLMPGDRVVADYRITCGNCYYCGSGRSNLCETAYDFGFDVDGAFSEFIVLPARQLVALPEEISFEVGSIIGCAVVTAYHALRVGEMRGGDSVAVIGVGGIGYNILKFARAFGASKLVAVDVDDRKLARAEKLGALTVNSNEGTPEKRIKDLMGNEGVNIAFDAIGKKSTAESAVRSVERAGKAVLVGICIEKLDIYPWQDLMMNPKTTNSGKQVQIRTTIDHLRTDLPEVLQLVKEKKIDLSDAVTHKIPLTEANRGLEILEQKIEDPMRIVMLP